MAAFSATFNAAEQPAVADTAGDRPDAVSDPADLRPPADLGHEARALVVLGTERAADYQDPSYAQEYVERLEPFIELAGPMGDAGQKLLCEVARQLALGMTYEDTIRVAELKIRGTRFDRVRTEVGADPHQVVEIAEFMHPRLAEIADTMPASIGRWMLRNRIAKSVIARLTSRGRIVRTSSLPGFLLLYAVASLRRFRRGTLRHDREMRFLTEWLDTVRRAAAIDVSLATGFARLRNLVKGYGDTSARGIAKYQAICAFLSGQLDNPSAAAHLETLITAAAQDEDGKTLRHEMDRLRPLRSNAGPGVDRALQAG
jgi:indolepyruvate ferredoxin oxidoreductase beta subunit